MSKNHYKRYNNASVISNEKYFGENGILQNFENYFIIFNKSEINYCWIFISDNFNKFLTFSGKCNFQICFGKVKINGVEFSAPFLEKMYSPMSHAKITIGIGNNSQKNSKSIEECIQNLCKSDVFSESELNVLNSLKDLQSDINCGNKWNVIRASVFECVVSDDLSQFKEFKRLFEVNTDFSFAKKLKFSFTEEKNPSYIMTTEIFDCIKDILNTMSTKKDVSVAVCGPKDSGKSTLMRTIINLFFAEGCTEVFILDGDPGQCEFTPNGCLTLTKVVGPLLGPPFTHQYSPNVKIIKQFFIGLLSPAEDPKLYCRTFEMLYHNYLLINSINAAPLIINTMGWPEGIGLSLLTFKLLLVNPTFVLQLKKGRSEKEFTDINDTTLNEARNCCFLRNLPKTLTSVIHILKSPVLTTQRHDFHLKPIQHRDLTMLSYLFYQTINSPLCFPADSLPIDYKYNPVTRLKSRIPHILKYSLNEDISNEIKTFHPMVQLKLIYSEIDDTILRHTIDQCFSLQLVAICCPYSKLKFKSVISKDFFNRATEIQPMYCVGMGIVSRVNEDNQEIDLLTGVDVALMDGSYLVKGKINCPDSLFLNQKELLSKNDECLLSFISPMNTVGIGKTAICTRKSLPKIRRHKH